MNRKSLTIAATTVTAVSSAVLVAKIVKNNYKDEKVKAFLELATQKKASEIFIIDGRPLSVEIEG